MLAHGKSLCKEIWKNTNKSINSSHFKCEDYRKIFRVVLKKFWFILMCVFVSMYVCAYCLGSSEEGIGAAGTGVNRQL